MYMLLDEYSSGGSLTTDRDLELRMADFFDLAQKDIAAFKRIVRSFVPAPTPAPVLVTAAEDAGAVLCPAPEGFGQVFRVWKDGRLSNAYPWNGTHILLSERDVGRVRVEYFAVPASIPQDAKDDYQFEVSDDAAACMVYFVAAQHLIVDLVVDASPLLLLYDRMRAGLDTRLPPAGGGGIRQRLFGGR